MTILYASFTLICVVFLFHLEKDASYLVAASTFDDISNSQSSALVVSDSSKTIVVDDFSGACLQSSLFDETDGAYASSVRSNVSHSLITSKIDISRDKVCDNEIINYSFEDSNIASPVSNTNSSNQSCQNFGHFLMQGLASLMSDNQTIDNLTTDTECISFGSASHSSIHHENNTMMFNQSNQLSGNSTPIQSTVGHIE